MKMWSTFRKDVITSRLQSIMESGEEVTVWQNRGDEKNKFQATIIEVNESNTILKLEESYKNADYNITKDNTLFVHHAKGDALFKRDSFKSDGLKLIIKTPAELMMKERRSIERFSFKYQDFKNVSFKIENKEDIDQLTCVLKDISIDGIGMVLHETDAKGINLGDRVNVTAITDQSIEQGLIAQVCYKTSYNIAKESGSKLFKIGLKFTETLESVVYKSISSIIEKKQIREKGLVVPSFNGLTEQEQEKIINKISEENLPLANNIREQNENIDKLRYLTLEMKRTFLLEVNLDLLATSLRLSSKELIFELMSGVTDTMRDEFLFKLDHPKSPSAINKAQDSIVKFIRKKEKLGELVLNPNSFEVIV